MTEAVDPPIRDGAAEETGFGQGAVAPAAGPDPSTIRGQATARAGVKSGEAGAEPHTSRKSNPLYFVLDRELCEAHLLIDFISECPAKSLPKTLPAEDALTDGDRPKGGWLERLCQINWPPKPEDTQDFAKAALLVRAKDALNRIASPASGASIAFTLLVAQEDNALQGPDGTKNTRQDAVRIGKTRTSLAREAFPGLVSKARWFRVFNVTLGICLTLWLGLTYYVSWYVALGNSQLVQHAQLKSVESTLLEKVASEETNASRVLAPSPPLAANQPTDVASGASETDHAFRPLCHERYASGLRKGESPYFFGYTNATDYQLCRDVYEQSAELLNSARTLDKWAHFRGKNVDPFKGIPQNDVMQVNIVADQTYGAASGWATLLGTSLLPILYGILGAGAAVVRNISRRTKDSLLTPRDLPISLMQLALGATIGSVIGLFVGPQNGSNAAGASLLGPVALSSSALSFIAGFGVEGVFRAIEGLINRIFGLVQAPMSAGPQGQQTPAAAQAPHSV